MTLRLCFTSATVTALAIAATGISQAQDTYPTRPIRMMVPFSPGGASDTAARVVGQQLAPRLGQQIVIENRPGAGGIIGTELAARATPDGYSLLMGSNIEIVINPNLYKKLPYNTQKDFAPVSLVADTPLILVVNPSVPAKSVQELIALAKAKPGVLNYASSGNGSTVQLASEMFKTMAGVNIRHIPFNGSGPAVIQTIAGETQLVFPAMPAALQQARSGKLRALAVTSAKRVAAAPELPTVAESGVPGYEMSIWNGLLAPAGTPKPVLDRLHVELLKVLAMPEVKQSFNNIGAEVVTGTPAQFAAFIKSDLAKYAKVVKDADVRID
ncbi:MAG: Bug family tripartite tricarboxylate transporter substrate binding protein [Burkholderiales bacterium]